MSTASSIQRSFRGQVHSPVAARLILLLAVLLTASAWFVSRQTAKNSAEARYVFRTTEIQEAIEARLLIHEQVLWGGAALFNASETVSRSEWAAYAATLDLDLPGMDGREVLVEVKTDPLLETIPVVVLTTSSADSDIDTAYRNYANS